MQGDNVQIGIRKESRHHRVMCSRCPRRFTRGMTRVFRFVVFCFCAECWGNHLAECEAIMQKVCPPIEEQSMKATA